MTDLDRPRHRPCPGCGQPAIPPGLTLLAAPAGNGKQEWHEACAPPPPAARFAMDQAVEVTDPEYHLFGLRGTVIEVSYENYWRTWAYQIRGASGGRVWLEERVLGAAAPGEAA